MSISPGLELFGLNGLDCARLTANRVNAILLTSRGRVNLANAETRRTAVKMPFAQAVAAMQCCRINLGEQNGSRTEAEVLILLHCASFARRRCRFQSSQCG
jgi:hypothetical protein